MLSRAGTFVTGSGKNAFKGLGFLHHGGNTKYGYYDNIMITNYNNEETVKMVAENVGIESESVKVDVAFSENLTGIPQNGDFVITDSFTGKRINYTVENSNERHAVLDVQTSEASKLNIAFSPSSGLSGTTSSQLSNKTTNIYTKHQQDGAVIPVLNEVKVYDYNGNSVNIDGSEVVPIGTTTANISFSEPMSFDDIEDKIYIQNVDAGERIAVNYTPSADAKSVSINFAELMSPNSDYEFVISDTLSLSENESVSLPREYKWSYKTADDGGFGIFGDAIVIDSETNTAKFKANIIKSDNAEYKGTIIICGYADKEVDGKVYTKLEKVDVKKYNIDTKSITSYETIPINLTGINRIKCFIRDTDANKNILISEKRYNINAYKSISDFV